MRSRLFLFDPVLLASAKSRLLSGDAALAVTHQKLIAEAEAALTVGPFSVMNKPVLPPSGDKHDYLSLARYYWPNPNTADGLPYIDRDGEINPEIWTISDHKDFDVLMDNVLILGLAFYFTEDERYAVHATRLMRVWFLDEATRMNPHLDFAQGIRGINNGRGIGIIETRELAQVVEAIGLIQTSKAWGASEQCGMQAWCAAFLQWLLTSKNGNEESKQANNHGTWYDSQVVALALFTDRLDVAREILTQRAPQRLVAQFELDGSQPHELRRTLSWHYCAFNLQAWYRLATFGKILGIDLWHLEAEGRSIRKATDYFLPYLEGKPWTYQQISPQKFDILLPLLRQAAVVYTDFHYREIANKAPIVDLASARAFLVY